MSLPGFDDWLTDQDRWAGYPSDDDFVNWREANEYVNDSPEPDDNESPENNKPCMFLRNNGDGTDRCEYEQLVPFMSPCGSCPDLMSQKDPF